MCHKVNINSCLDLFEIDEGKMDATPHEDWELMSPPIHRSLEGGAVTVVTAAALEKKKKPRMRMGMG